MLGWNESAWSAMLLGAALKSTIVLGAAWLLAWVLRRRSAAARHLVWTAAAAALLALPLLSVSLPALRVRTHALASLVPTVTFRTDAVAIPGAPVAADPPLARSAGAPTAAPWHPDFRLWLMLLWAAGSALALAHLLAAYALMWRTRRRALPFADPELFDAISYLLGIRGDVELLALPLSAMPMSFGVLRPAVFLPADAHQWSEDRRRVVLLHELAHVKRGDMATHLLLRMAACLFWWNPLAWTAWRESLKESERAADDLVLTAGERAADYASHLLEIARSMQRAPRVAWAAVAMARPSQLEGRLLAILDPRIDRQSPGRRSALAAAVLAVALVAPFAALEAQDAPPPPPPPTVDTAIRAATEQQNPAATDSAAAAYEKNRKYDEAQQLLEDSLALRAQTSGDHSSAYAIGLMKLGDLAVKRHQYAEAEAFYFKALSLGDTPETAPALIYVALHTKDTTAAKAFLDRAIAAAQNGPVAGRALTLRANYSRDDGFPGVAETQYIQALAQDPPNSSEAAFTMESYAKLLTSQSRTSEAQGMQQNAKTIREARVAEMAPHWTGAESAPAQPNDAAFRGTGPADHSNDAAPPAPKPPTRDAGGVSGPVFKVGGGVSAPKLLSKLEPDYSEEARAAKYQGTVVLKVVIGTDGQAYNLELVRGLGNGLDEKAAEAVMQWKFAPGKRDGVPVAIAATIEVNFRLL
jgi:TonB family protein